MYHILCYTLGALLEHYIICVIPIYYGFRESIGNNASSNITMSTIVLAALSGHNSHHQARESHHLRGLACGRSHHEQGNFSVPPCARRWINMALMGHHSLRWALQSLGCFTARILCVRRFLNRSDALRPRRRLFL